MWGGQGKQQSSTETKEWSSLGLSFHKPGLDPRSISIYSHLSITSPLCLPVPNGKKPTSPFTRCPMAQACNRCVSSCLGNKCGTPGGAVPPGKQQMPPPMLKMLPTISQQG